MDDFLSLMLVGQQKEELSRVIACNEKSQKYGLILSDEEARTLMMARKDSLKECQRVEFGSGILPEIIRAFCDSPYLNQADYGEVLAKLQDIFYLYKNESENALTEELTDLELIDFMRTQFDTICFGDLDYLSGTCLERFTRAIRSGYQSESRHKARDEYTLKESGNEYHKLSEETRWDFELYKTKLEDLE